MNVVEVLAGECEAVSALLLSLGEDDLVRPTRCVPWSVKDLVAHMWRAMFRIPTALDERPIEGLPDTDSVTYWRSYDPLEDSPATTEHAQQTAAEHDTGRAMAESFDDVWRSCVARAHAEDPKRVIQTWFGPRLELDEFLATRVLEMLVHGLDLTVALDHPPIATPAGTEVVRSILTGLFGTELPSGLEWTDIDFIEKACGRVPLTERDQTILREQTRAFPLLG
jgi:uncharacterized protein (TIGR03083 family)